MNLQKALIAYASHMLFAVINVVGEDAQPAASSLFPLNIGPRDLSAVLEAVGLGDLDDFTDPEGLGEISETVPQAVRDILQGSAFVKDNTTVVTKFPTNILTKNGRFLAVPPLIFNVDLFLRVKLCNFGNVVRAISTPPSGSMISGPLGGTEYTFLYQDYEWQCPIQNETDKCRAASAINGKGTCAETSFVLCNIKKYGNYLNASKHVDGCVVFTSPIRTGSPSETYQFFVNDLTQIMPYNKCIDTSFPKDNLRVAVNPLEFIYTQFRGQFFDKVLGQWINAVIVTVPSTFWTVASYEQLQVFCKLENATGQYYENRLPLNEPEENQRPSFSYTTITNVADLQDEIRLN